MKATLWVWARFRAAVFEWQTRRVIARAAKRYVRDLKKRTSTRKET